jgi:hypothetical protein
MLMQWLVRSSVFGKIVYPMISLLSVHLSFNLWLVLSKIFSKKTWKGKMDHSYYLQNFELHCHCSWNYYYAASSMQVVVSESQQSCLIMMDPASPATRDFDPFSIIIKVCSWWREYILMHPPGGCPRRSTSNMEA